MAMGDPNQEVREKFQDSYRLEEEQGGGDKAKAMLGGGLDFLKRNLVIIILVLVIGGGLLWYFVLRPQPSSLIVEVAKLDEEGGLGSASVSVLDSSGKSLAEGISDDDGFASFDNLPSEQDLSLRVEAPSNDYNTVSKTVRLKSGEKATTQKVDVDLKTGLKFDNPSLSLNLALGCSKDIQITLNNKGKADESGTIVASDSIADYVKLEASDIPVPAGSSASVLATAKAAKVNAKPTDVSGEVRLKFTKEKMKLSIKASGDAPKLSVSFDHGDAKVFSVKSSALPATKKSQVSVKNNGKKTAIPLTGVTAQVEGDVAQWVKLDLSQLEEANSGDGIAALGQAFIGFEMTVPEGTKPAPYDGRFTVKSDCGSVTTPLTVTVQ